MSQLVQRLLEQAGLPTDLKQIIGRMFVATASGIGDVLITGTITGMAVHAYEDNSGHLVLSVSTTAIGSYGVYIVDVRWSPSGWIINYSDRRQLAVDFSLL